MPKKTQMQIYEELLARIKELAQLIRVESDWMTEFREARRHNPAIQAEWSHRQGLKYKLSREREEALALREVIAARLRLPSWAR